MRVRLSRRSSGSMSSFAARSSIVCSSAKAPCGCPGARIAAPGPAFVKTSFSSVCRDAICKGSAPDPHIPRPFRSPRCRMLIRWIAVMRAVLLCADPQRLVGTGAVANGKMFFLAIQHQAHRSAGLLRKAAATTPGLPAPNFAPKPPPMNSVMTRILVCGILKNPASSSRTLDVPCVEE